MSSWFNTRQGKTFLKSQEAHRKLCVLYDKSSNSQMVAYHYRVWIEQQALGRVLSKDERAKIFRQSKD